MSLVPTRPRHRVGRRRGVVAVVLLLLSPTFGRAAVSGQYRPLLPPDGLTNGCYPLPGGVVPDFAYVLRRDGDTVDAARAAPARGAALRPGRRGRGDRDDPGAVRRGRGGRRGRRVSARDFPGVPDDAVVRGEMVLDLPVDRRAVRRPGLRATPTRPSASPPTSRTARERARGCGSAGTRWAAPSGSWSGCSSPPCCAQARRLPRRRRRRAGRRRGLLPRLRAGRCPTRCATSCGCAAPTPPSWTGSSSAAAGSCPACRWCWRRSTWSSPAPRCRWRAPTSPSFSTVLLLVTALRVRRTLGNAPGRRDARLPRPGPDVRRLRGRRLGRQRRRAGGRADALPGVDMLRAVREHGTISWRSGVVLGAAGDRRGLLPLQRQPARRRRARRDLRGLAAAGRPRPSAAGSSCPTSPPGSRSWPSWRPGASARRRRSTPGWSRRCRCRRCAPTRSATATSCASASATPAAASGSRRCATRASRPAPPGSARSRSPTRCRRTPAGTSRRTSYARDVVINTGRYFGMPARFATLLRWTRRPGRRRAAGRGRARSGCSTPRACCMLVLLGACTRRSFDRQLQLVLLKVGDPRR